MSAETEKLIERWRDLSPSEGEYFDTYVARMRRLGAKSADALASLTAEVERHRSYANRLLDNLAEAATRVATAEAEVSRLREALTWRPISEKPTASPLNVLLYYPSEVSPDFDGADYSLQVARWDNRLSGFSGWWQQGTNHDCFEMLNVENGDVPTHWMPLASAPEVVGAQTEEVRA